MAMADRYKRQEKALKASGNKSQSNNNHSEEHSYSDFDIDEMFEKGQLEKALAGFTGVKVV